AARRSCLLIAAFVAVAGVAVVSAPSALAATTPRPAPSPVATGYNHTLALAADGTVRAFGAGDNGDLGVAGHAEHDTAVQVQGVGGVGVLSHVAAVAAGSSYSLGLLATGNVVAWGNNTTGELGDNTNNNERTTPVYVTGPSGSGHLGGIVAIAANPIGTTSVALKSDGTVWAWGSTNTWQLGVNNGNAAAKLPVEVHGPGNVGYLTNIVAIAVGKEHSVALKSDGTVWTWGVNAEGELGNGVTGSEVDWPVQVVGVGGVGNLTNVVGISAGGYSTLALKSDGTMVGWGDDQYGQLGDSNAPSVSNTPVAPVGLGGSLVAIAGGTYATFAVKADGTVWGWGNNTNGYLGVGSATTPIQSPHRVQRLVDGSGVVALAAGFQTGAAVTAPGAVYRWGWNSSGQLGDSTTIDADSPVRAVSLPKIANPALLVLVAPTISGTATAGHALAVSKGTWGLPATAWAYQWLRNGAAILHATNATYTLTTADKGKKISARVTAHRAGYPNGVATTASRTVSS
ncbi:MAG: hypothetical protein QOI08_53, partial [Actinomycetota bacterium]|nr:hypothetical protein [Actinomycetota bacterium]